MKIYQKIWSILLLISSIATVFMGVLCILHVFDVIILMLPLGITQLFGGLRQINLEGANKASKSLSIFV